MPLLNCNTRRHAFRRALTFVTLAIGVPAWAVTFNLSQSEYPECSTSWSVSGTTYSCTGDGQITLDDGDDIIANTPATLVANDGFELGNGTVGSSANPIDLISSYGDIEVDETTLYGNLEANSGDIVLEDSELTGSITTNGEVDLVDSTITGDVYGQNGVEVRGSNIDGTLSANSNISLEGGSVTGQVTSFSNQIEAENTDLLGGAQAQSGMSFEGGTLSGDFVMTSNNPIEFEDATVLSGSVSGASSVSIEDSTFGSPSNPVNVSSTSGEIEVDNSTVYGNLTAPSYSEVDVSNNSDVYGFCSPGNPNCQQPMPEPPENCSLGDGLKGQYYNNRTLSGTPAYEDVVSTVDFIWGNDSPSTAAVGNDNFSVRWTGYLYAPASGTYTLGTNSDDGARLYIDGNLIINDWSDHAPRIRTGTVSLQAGDLVPVTLEYYENGGGATIQLLWEPPGESGLEVIPASALFNCTSTTPVAYYPLNETSYSGAAGEILDYSGNNNHASTSGNITPASGYTCEGASVPANNSSALRSAIDTGLNPGEVTPSTGTLSFWYKSNLDWDGDNQDRVLFSANSDQFGNNNKYFYLTLRNNGRLRFEFEDSNDSDFNFQSDNSTRNFNADEWVHVAVTWDMNNGDYGIYANGTLVGDLNNRNTTGLLSQLNSLYIGDNRSNYVETGRSANGVFDEVRLYAYAQSSTQILADMDDTVVCSTPGTCVTDPFDTSLSSDWQTLRSSGNFTPQVVGGRLRLTPDTNNIATATTLLRQFPSANNRIVVEFDFYAYKDNGVTNAADGVTVTFSDRDITPFPGSFGGSLGYAQRDNGDAGFNGGWLGIGLDEFGNYSNPTEGREGGPGARSNAIAIRGYGSGTTGYRYLRGTAANISPTVLTSSATPHRYRITIDHSNGIEALVKIERNSGSGFETLVSEFDALSESGQPAIPQKLVLTLTGSTGGSSANHEIDNLQVCADIIEPYDAPIHHFELVRNQAVGLTCEALDVTIRACANEACTLEYTDPFTATLSAVDDDGNPVNGWEGGSQITDVASGHSINFLPDSAGTYTLDIPTSTPSTVPLTQNLCFVGGSTTAEANCEVTFNDVGLRFFPTDNSTSTAYFDLIAGETMAEESFSVQAVRTNTTTGICEGLFSENETLDFTTGTQCSDPATCSPSQQVSLTNAGTTTVLPNPQNQIAGENTTTLPLTFTADSTADFSLLSPDVGVQPLTLEYTLPDVDGNPSSNTLSQTVNLRIKPAELRLLRIRNSDGDLLATDGSVTASADAPVFTRAGELFQLEVQALNAEGDPTPNFARTATLPTINWVSTRVAPSDADARGSLSGGAGTSTPGAAWEPYELPDETVDTSTLSLAPGMGLSYSDLGVFDLQGQIEDYLARPGSPAMTVDSDTVRVGRFIPAYLRITQDNPANWGTASYQYQSQSAVLSAIPLRVEAFDINNAPVFNYDGDFFKLALDTSDLYQKPAGLDNTGGGLSYDTVNWALSDNNDYNGEVTLTLDATELVWPRPLTGPTASDTPQVISEFVIAASKLDDGEACHGDLNQCDSLSLELNDVTLYYARLNAEHQVSAQVSDPPSVTAPAELPIWLEVLNGVDSSITPNDFIFEKFPGDSDTGNTEIPGLTYQGVCEPGSLNCNIIANSADGTLGDLNNGSGTLVAESTTAGIVGVLVDVENWLTWDWDVDAASAMTGPPSTLYFGVFQGQSPLLFQLDGFR